MKRNLLLIIVIAAALAVMIWAGVSNVSRRHREEAHLRQLQEKIETAQPAGSNVASQVADAASPYGPANPLQGQVAPAFTLPNTHGKNVSLADFKGKAVVLDFWATWCPPCKIEIPWLAGFQTKYGGQGLQVIGVSEDELDVKNPKELAKEKRDIATKAAKLGINYPVLYDVANVSTPYGGVEGLPTTFFIDRSGKIIASTVGLTDKSQIEANILKALGSGAKS